MTLRRTPLTRRTELRRGGTLTRTPMRRAAGLAARSVAAARRVRDTGPTAATRQVVLDRAGGCCEVCDRLLHDGYTWQAVHSFHHRQPRGMGGSTGPEVNSPANLLLVCGTGTTGCHGDIESDRSVAVALGLLVPRPADPASTAVFVGTAAPSTSSRRHVYLTHEGSYQEVAA